MRTNLVLSYKPLCACSSYAFPHRIGGGHCECSCIGIVDGKWLISELCSECGQPADAIDIDFGIGEYEYWGYRGIDRNVQTVSTCCEAPLVKNSWSNHQQYEWEVYPCVPKTPSQSHA